jgi:hypothetical protein
VLYAYNEQEILNEDWVMASGVLHGSFNPLSFLLRTWADDRSLLISSFPSYPDSWPPKEIPSQEALFSIANFIHEYTHYLQITSRLVSLSYLRTLRNQASWTLDMVKSLMDSGCRKYVSPRLPLLEWIFKNLPKERSGDWIANWLGFETINRLIYGQSFYVREEQYGKNIDRLFKQFYEQHKKSMLELPDPLFPRIRTSCLGGMSEKEEQLYPLAILENEANVNVFLFLGMWYGLETSMNTLSRIFGPTFSYKNFGIAFEWIKEGIASLFPLAVDLSFQTWPDEGMSFKDFHPCWRFMSAWEVCLKFKGCDQNGTFLQEYDEISTLICETNGWKNPSSYLKQAVDNNINSVDIAKGDSFLPQLLRFILQLRIKYPYWFYSPTSYVDYLLNKIPVPFVRFRKQPGHTFWLGQQLNDKKESEYKYFDIFNEVFLMWSGREVATAKIIRCPICEFVNDSSCQGECIFSRWFESTWGFKHDTTTISN